MKKKKTKYDWVYDALEKYAKAHRVIQKGYLCVGLVVTRSAQYMTFPLDERNFLAKSGGQVRGLGKGAVQRILEDYEVTRVLAEEGGRTSRGSLRKMRDYLSFLNTISGKEGFDLLIIEKWWIERVQQYFAGKPFRLRVMVSWSLRRTIRDILDQAEKRQNHGGGTMFVGAVMQHLIGAKLELVLGEKLEHHGFTVADAPLARPGDFTVGDVAIHVTRTPSEALIRKCADNIDAGLRPLIITSQKGTLAADALAENKGIENQIDIFEIEQFLATNLYEMSRFINANRKPTAGKLIERYNIIVGDHETDPSLMIRVI